jgi:hypothetical protein
MKTLTILLTNAECVALERLLRRMQPFVADLMKGETTTAANEAATAQWMVLARLLRELRAEQDRHNRPGVEL